MPRYINADALYEKLTGIPLKKMTDEDQAEWRRLIDILGGRSAFEVVRCRECKHASPNGKYGCKAYHFKLYETHEMKADDFCSHGERRE